MTLTSYIKKRKGVLFIIGHNTKAGEFAGANENMQMVDAHMVLEYDKKTGIRKIYWGQKNRKGPMGTLYYEIKDGKILYFLPEEYEAVEELAKAGFDPLFGARPLRRVIQERVDNALADALLRGEIGRKDQVMLLPGGKLDIQKANKI
jgi:hypothetical protein